MTAATATAEARAGGRARLMTALAPAAVYLGVRLVGLVGLGLLAAARDASVVDALTSWDGAWFHGLADGGYDGVPGDLTDANGNRNPHTPLAFFPGYPAVVAVLGVLPGLGTTGAALLVSLLAGIACGYGLVALAGLVPGGSRRTGLVLVALFAASPMGVVLSMAYSEALFCALAVWCLVALLRERWLLAGAACAAAGLIRPTGVALVVAVGLAVIVAAADNRGSWRSWVGGLLAPAGLLGYLGFVWARTGQPDGWFELQRQGWDSRFDGGAATVGFGRQVLTTAPSVLEVGTVAVLAGAVVLAGLCVPIMRERPMWPLLAYGVVVLAMDLGSNGLMNSKARLLLPAFVLLIPIAHGLSRLRRGTAVAVLGAVACVSAWFGAYALVIWPYAI